MLISLNIGLRDDPGANPEDFLAKVRAAARHKFASVWWPQPSPGDGIPPWDALTSLAVIGSHVPGIGLGTAVVSSHLQHPLVLAARALTVQAATGNRLTLGIGSGHQHTVETVYGIAYDGSPPSARVPRGADAGTRPQAHGASRSQLRRTERGAQHSRREPSGSRPRRARTCHAQARRELG